MGGVVGAVAGVVRWPANPLGEPANEFVCDRDGPEFAAAVAAEEPLGFGVDRVILIAVALVGGALNLAPPQALWLRLPEFPLVVGRAVRVGLGDVGAGLVTAPWPQPVVADIDVAGLGGLGRFGT